MLPTDRFRWSSKDGLTERRLDSIRLPSMAWQWEGEWHIETTLDGQQLDDDVSYTSSGFLVYHRYFVKY